MTYPPDLPDVGSSVTTLENQPGPLLTLGKFRFKSSICGDVHPEARLLTERDLANFLEKQSVHVDVVKARSDLYWYDFKSGADSSVRLRLAVLDNAASAAKDLHASLLEHGPGWWGVRRSNLAILAPRASLREALGFALKYKFACWGVFTYAGADDAYVVPGSYAEL